MPEKYDFAVIGAGMGGAAFLSMIAATGARVLVLERGTALVPERQNWDLNEILVLNRYRCKDIFYDSEGRQFTPRMYYKVGGSSKVYGAVALRFRSIDFEESRFDNYISPAWPISYEELAPYYALAEQNLHVSGEEGEDPSEAERGRFPYPSYEHEEYIDELAADLKKQGLHPFHLPLAIDAARCRKGSPCDGFPCRIRAKYDAENAFILPAMQKQKNVELRTDSYVEKLELAADEKRIDTALVRSGKDHFRVQARYFVLAAGAINSALLMLRSASRRFPEGLANSSDQVGRNYMTHINSVMMAIRPFRKNKTRFQKTLGLHDFYHRDYPGTYRLGGIQTRGKIREENLRKHRNVFIRLLRRFIAARSADFWLMTEDFPQPENRVYYDREGKARLEQKLNNVHTHRRLVAEFSTALRRAGFLWIHSELRESKAVQHQCGTLRFGVDAKNSVLNKECRCHDIENLYVTDASIFPSSAAVNPALTVAANALRVGEHLKNIWKKKKKGGI